VAGKTLAESRADVGKLRQLKSGVMHYLLTGSVRVPVADAPRAASAG
jgi:hypothetical protein